MFSTAYQLLPPLQELTPKNHGPLVVVCSLLVVIVAALTVFTRLLTRYSMARKLFVDDCLIVFAMILSTLQTACLIVACNHGLGRHRNDIEPAVFSVYSKALYAADILLIATLTFTKSSVTCLIVGLNPPPKILYTCYAILGVIIVWSIAAIIATAFRCDLPQPWDRDGHCIDLFGLDVFNCVVNITTDLALIAVPAYLMVNVQVANAKRLLVIGLFGSRIIIVPFAIITIVKRQEAFTASASNDFTWQLVASSMWLQSMVALSIMTACLPSIRRFLADLRTGLMGVHICESLELTMKNSMSAEADPERRPSNLSFRITSIFNRSQGSFRTHEERPSFNRRQSTPREQFARGRDVMSRTTVSHGSVDNQLTDNVIMQTIDYQVEYQDKNALGTSKVRSIDTSAGSQ